MAWRQSHTWSTSVLSDIITNAPTYITDNNMVLTNNSYYSCRDGCPGEGAYDVLSNYIDKQMRRYKQLLHVVAAGNDGVLPVPLFQHLLLQLNRAGNVQKMYLLLVQ